MKKRIIILAALAVITAFALITCDNEGNGNTADPVTISLLAIPGITQPAYTETPVTVVGGNDQYTGTVKWEGDLAQDGTFDAEEDYTAIITLTPKSGYKLDGVLANSFIVAGAIVTHAAGSGTVTAEFPQTGSVPPTTVNIKPISGVTVPAAGQTPVNSIFATAQFSASGTVTWLPAHSTFQAGTAYTATINLAANSGFTFNGVEENFFTVLGATATNPANSGIVTAVFPVTPVDLFALSAMDFVKEIKLGINLGNCLDAYGGGAGMTVYQLETLWFKRETTLSNIQGIKAGGMNTIRIPVTWAKAFESGTLNIRADWMARVTEIVDWALDEGMFVILNTHHDSSAHHPENFVFPLTDTLVDQGLARFRTMWEQIAENFKWYPAELIFQGMNEPSQTTNGNRDWTGRAEYYANLNKYYVAFVEEVRKTGANNAKRFLIINTYFAGTAQAQVNGLTLPPDTATNKLIVGFHSYNPSNLCLAGSATTWDGNRATFTGGMDLIKTKFVDHGVPAIITEFGIMNKDNLSTRIAWAEAFTSEAKKRGMPCIWWDDGEAYGEKEELLGFYDRHNDEFFFPTLLDAIKRGAGLIN